MKALVLAAGLGSRLQHLTKDQPKCMISVNNEKLIDRLIRTLISNNITTIGVATGYLANYLKIYLIKNYPQVNFEFFHNPIYDETNNIYSLYQARSFLNEDILLIESDLIFKPELINELINCDYQDCAVVAPFEYWMDGTCVLLNEENRIERFISKQKLNFNENNYKTVNIYKISKLFLDQYFLPALEEKINNQFLNDYYELILEDLVDSGVPIYAYVNSEFDWYEIDDIQDLDIAECIFATGELKLQKYQNRYGGYWRFPKVKDFCYLVNPFFPTKQMYNEFKYSFNTLLNEYPSGQTVNAHLASKMFRVKPEYIAVGNGAAELIKSSIELLEGNHFGVIYPTFNEYPNRIGSMRIKKLIMDDIEKTYSIDILKDLSHDVDVIVLINPDNPTGNFIPKNKIIDLLNYCKTTNTKLIYDESFVDFAGEETFTMIENELLEKYDNLIVIKSISKSYGVPGGRLGVIVTQDVEFIKYIRKDISIWNINSFGEFFLQIFGKYEKDYINACKEIAKERDWLFEQLSQFKEFDVMPSKANYFTCRLTSECKFSSQQLAIKLLEYNFFIKDLAYKEGVANGEYIRLAVRNRKDNTQLINTLKHLFLFK